MAYVIGVDCGTSGTKTVLFREDGTVMASATIEYPMYQPKNGYAEQDPADWKDAMIRTIQTVVTKSGVSKEEIKARSGHAGQGQQRPAEVHHLVRPANRCGSRRNEPCCGQRKADGDHR